ncbi:hypothetical protein PDJAM_G00183120 [Pangasius djambal]|uniref:Uncharacterized protein n=1 Tax=Pangasius djambal TaxID=1691987 RepID=A0ACC5Y3Z8_9TELE|nr:hypothetical protein [Pangasius djambal]
MGAKPSKRDKGMIKGVVPLDTGTAAMLGVLQGTRGKNDEDEDSGSEREFDEPLCALVQNCTMLHNIVGPACIFLRQGFAQAQLSSLHNHYIPEFPSPSAQHHVNPETGDLSTDKHLFM